MLMELKLLLLAGLVMMASKNLNPTSPWNSWFPDLVNVSWAHAVNSEKLLKQSVNEGVRMIEADVLVGDWISPGGKIQNDVTIMAHPPLLISDLSLEQMVQSIRAQSTAGLKLDFKSIEAAETAKTLFRIYHPELYSPGPLMLNADILPGPGSDESNFTRVNAKDFLGLFKKLPQTVLSLGWTTKEGGDFESGYGEKHINQMIQLLKEENVDPSYVTFAVRAYLFSVNPSSFLPLLGQVRNSTITIWHANNDKSDDHVIQNLAMGINLCGVNRFFIDIPGNIKERLLPLLIQ